MLRELHIENIAVIEKADIEFNSGLNVLTGETGAGKSIIIDSIGAVLGERVSRELVRRGADKGRVTAVFELGQAEEEWLNANDIEPDDELILQRRINTDGKSSCRVCGEPVSVSQLRELATLLVDIHGQNDGRQLMDERRHITYLDSFGALDEDIDAYKAEYSKFISLKKEMNRLSMDEIEKERLSDSLKYQIAELERAELKEGEKDTLTARRDLLRNSEKLTEALDSAYEILNGGDENAICMAQNAGYFATRAADIVPELQDAAEKINSASFSLADAAEILKDFRDGLDFSPQEYDSLESRISLLNRLERKYNRDEDSLISYLDECRKKLDDIEYADERLVKLQKELATQVKMCLKVGEILRAKRIEAGTVLEHQIEKELKELSMPSVRFKVNFEPIQNENGFDATGIDSVSFLMAANTGENLGKISKIASGGELSRIMLAMKNVFAENDSVSTMIFDEIDTGVSGIAAQRVGEKLYTVSGGKQVLCVTHLPQIAAMADSHYLISKEERNGRTYTDVKCLNREGRQRELARLHGGDNITELTIMSAEEQIESADKYKRRVAGDRA